MYRLITVLFAETDAIIQIAVEVAAVIVSGAPIDVADKITQADILAVAGDIENESSHCALLAVNTLKEAITDFKSHNCK